MDGVSDLGLFILAGLILNITPGPDLLYIAGRSAVQGRKAGVVAALGIGAGCLFHVLAAALGLSMILVSSSLLFSLVRYVGAAYLFYLGITTLFSVQNLDGHAPQLTVLPLAKIFRQAILINVLNPKVALFFMALLPQFVAPAAEYPTRVFLFLGLLFNVNGTLVNILFGLFASAVSNKIKATAGLCRLMRSLAGALFMAFGLRLALIS